MITAAAPTPTELTRIRDEITADLREIASGLEAAHPAELERAAAVLLVLFDDPDAPAELTETYAAGLGAIADEPCSAGLLGAFSVLARERLASHAGAALAELGATRTPGVGELRLAQAQLARGSHADLVLALLEREGDPLAQVACLSIADDGRLGDGFLTPPAERAEVDSLLEVEANCEPLTAAELAALLRSALELSIAEGLEVPFEVCAALPIVSRAVSGDPAALPRPPAAHPAHPLDVDGLEDEDELRELVDELVESFEESVLAELDEDSPLAQAGAYMCGSLLDWKGSYSDGRLGHWTCDDLSEYLLGHFPRKVCADEQLIAVAPDAIAAFIRHLEDEGLLTGERADHLAETCAELRPKFERRARDRANFGPAKAIFTQMEAEGVEPTCQEELDTWLADFNSRPRAERDRVLGPSLPSPAGGPRHGAPSGGQPARRSKRKGAKASRRRNRRS